MALRVPHTGHFLTHAVKTLKMFSSMQMNIWGEACAMIKVIPSNFFYFSPENVFVDFREKGRTREG